MYFSWRCLPKLWFSGVLIMHQWGRAVIQYYKHFPPPRKRIHEILACHQVLVQSWIFSRAWFFAEVQCNRRYASDKVSHLVDQGKAVDVGFWGDLTKLLVHRMFIIQLIQACEQLAELKDPAYKWGHTRLVASHQCCSPWLNFRAFHCF